MRITPRDQVTYYKLPIFCFVSLILLQFFPWSYHTSGVLQTTYAWGGYTFGYGAFLPEFSNWELNKENLYYIHQFQTFLNTPGSFVDYASGFEFQRSLYAIFTRAFWFLGPLWSGVFVNVLAWGLSCWATVYVTAQFFTGRFPQIIAAILVASGPGFLYSVGEISPHVIGYASGFWALGLVVSYRLWLPESTWQQHFYVYAIIGLLQLCYNSPWLSLPTVFTATLYWMYHHKKFTFQDALKLGGCLTAALLPSMIFILMSKLIMKAPGAITYHLASLWAAGLSASLKRYVYVFTDAFLAYGPLIVFGTIAGLFLAFKKRATPLLTLSGLGIMQLAMATPFLLYVTARGYVTFAISIPFIMLSVFALNTFAQQKIGKVISMALLVFYVVYNNALFLGIPLIGKGFEWGYMETLKGNQQHNYEVRYLD